jgi:general secretion pathway protein H
MAPPRTSPAGRADGGEDGFTLIEVICVIAIVTALAAVLLPAIPRGTSRASLHAYALEIAALLKNDRNAAIRRRTEMRTTIDVNSRAVRAAASGRIVQVPGDVRFDATLAARCNDRPAGSNISFFSSGMSCGGVLALSRLGAGFEIRVNWLTGGVEVVPRNVL